MLINNVVQVFDLTRVRGLTSLTNVSADVRFTHGELLNRTHNIVINEDTGFAYLVGSNLCKGGLYMVDIRTPLSPEYAGCFSDDGYTHDAQCVVYDGPDTRFVGREVRYFLLFSIQGWVFNKSEEIFFAEGLFFSR
jgi:choice-of-anchor B domain-containing protein